MDLTADELTQLAEMCDRRRAEVGMPDHILFRLLDDMYRLWSARLERDDRHRAAVAEVVRGLVA